MCAGPERLVTLRVCAVVSVTPWYSVGSDALMPGQGLLGITAPPLVSFMSAVKSGTTARSEPSALVNVPEASASRSLPWFRHSPCWKRALTLASAR